MLSYASNYNATVIVTSDTCSVDPSKDTSGQYVVDQLKSINFAQVTKIIVPDDKKAIQDCLRSTLGDPENALVITVGGTGLCPRDVTPEATSSLYERDCIGISTALLMASLRYSSHAALSRLTAGIAGNCLIINFPGKQRACEQCFDYIRGILEHALEQVRFNLAAIKLTHQKQEVSDKNGQTSEESPSHGSSSSELPKDPNGDEKLEAVSSDSKKSPSPKSTVRTVTKFSKLSLSPKSPESSMKLQCSIKSLKTDETSGSIKNVCTPPGSPRTKPPMTGSPYPLVSYDEALEIMDSLSLKASLNETEIELDSFDKTCHLVGEIIACDMHSKTVVPPFSVSTMDGYVVNIPRGMMNKLASIKKIPAVLVEDVEEFERLQGDAGVACTFFCYQVNTGCRLPVGEDFLVVPFEESGPITTISISQKPKKIVVLYELEPKKYIRPAGSDLTPSDFIKAGTVIKPVELSLLLSMGYQSVRVIQKPSIGILSTGDELVECYKRDLKESYTNYVIDTNGPLLASLFQSKGCPVVKSGIVKDLPEEIESKIVEFLEESDILVITGGASMGTKDHVKDTLKKIGCTIHFGRVNLKPGKPAAFASFGWEGNQKLIFALPGNPVSAYITSLVLVLPFIQQLTRRHFGCDSPMTLHSLGNLTSVKINCILDSEPDEFYTFDGRLEFVRAKFVSTDESEGVSVSIRQQSSRMLNLKDCNCLLLVKPSMKGLRLLVGQTYPGLKL